MREFEHLHTLVEIRPVGALVPFEFPQDFILLPLPRRTLPVIEFLIYPAIKLVLIHRLQPALQLLILSLQDRQLCGMMSFLVRMAFLERGNDPAEHFVIHLYGTDRFAELAGYLFFPHPFFWTLPLVTGAVIIDVPVLLFLSDQRTAAVTARQ